MSLPDGLQPALPLAVTNRMPELERHIEVATVLINRGADISVRDEKGAAPLYYAVTGIQYD